MLDMVHGRSGSQSKIGWCGDKLIDYAKRNSQDTSHLRAHFLVFQMDSTGRKIKKSIVLELTLKDLPHPILTNCLPLLKIDE